MGIGQMGHLKAEDFVNLLEGLVLPAKQQQHLDSCARCRATWESMRPIHTEMFSLDANIPENMDPSVISSKRCKIEWPPKTGRLIDIPEVDRAAWFPLPEAARKIVSGQRAILEALAELLGG